MDEILMTSIAIPTTSSGLLAVPMDPRIWSRLQQPLLDRVLAFLPAPAFFRARAVCRRWYSLLFSGPFLDLSLRLSPRRPSFLFFLLPAADSRRSLLHPPTPPLPPPAAFLFDTADNTWHRLPFHSILPPGFSPAASHAGVVCWVSNAAGPKTLLLCNPLSKLVAQLPPAPRPRLCPSVGLAVGQASITSVVAGDDLISPFAVKNLTAEGFVLDGATGFCSPWATVSPLPRLCNLESGRMAFAGGKFYCMSYSPFGVLSYDAGANEWCKIQPPMRRFLRSPSLVECGGRAVLVAAVEKSKLNVPRSVRIWALQPGGRMWAEAERMPLEVYRQFAEAEGGRGFECAGHGGVIAITIRGATDVLLFDFRRKAWWWAPPCPFVPDGAGAGAAAGLRGLPYEPHLATPAIGLLDPSSLSFQPFNP